jgi:signal transduction histidine kinase
LEEKLQQVQRLQAIGTLADGIIHFTSTLGKGTTFYIYLPAAEQHLVR